MAFGDAILNLLGQPDPRRALLEAQLKAQGGGSTPPAAGGAPGAAAPATPAQPTAYTSPPQLLELYDGLLNRSTRERRIDNGIGLIASSFAQPDNRANIMQAAKGDYQSPSDVLSLVNGIQTAQMEAQEREKAAMRRQESLDRIPAIMEQYGLGGDAARTLWDNDQLDDFIMQAEKARTEAVAAGNKPPEYEVKSFEDGSTVAINKNQPTDMIVLNTPVANTTDTKDYTFYKQDEEKAGRTPKSFQEWSMMKPPSSSVTVNNAASTSKADQDLLTGLDTRTLEDFNAANDSIKTIENVQGARRQLNQEGGVITGDLTAPLRLETAKVMSTMFGMDPSAAENTQAFQSQMRAIVLPLVKQLGTGNSISNADREFVEKTVGSDITMSEGAARRILDILERGQRRNIIKANSKMQARVEASQPDSALRKVFQPAAVPDYSPEYIESVKAGVPEDALAELMKAPDDKANRKEFDDVFGAGRARDILEALMGTDFGI